MFILLSITSIFSFMFITLLVATATLDGLLPYRTVLNCFHLLWTIVLIYFELFSYILGWFYRLIIVLTFKLFIVLIFKLFTFQVTYIIFFTILLCFHLFSSAVRPLPPLWYQSHSFLASGSVVVSLFIVRVYPNAWYSVVVFPSYRRWCHPSRKVHS